MSYIAHRCGALRLFAIDIPWFRRRVCVVLPVQRLGLLLVVVYALLLRCLLSAFHEADYDSETQACVDRRTGGPSSFYDHFVTRRIKSKGKGGGVDVSATQRLALSVACDDEVVSDEDEESRLRPVAAARQRRRQRTKSSAVAEAAIVSVPTHQLLDVPVESHTVSSSRGLDVVERRYTHGRMPPRDDTVKDQ